MRKLSLLIIILSISSLCCAQKVYKLNETFDSITSGIPAGWDNSEGSTTVAAYKWSSHASGHQGRCLKFDSYDNDLGLTNFLKTPSMNLSQGEWVLRFWYKNPYGGDFSVYISTDGGATYPTCLATNLTNQPTWTEKEIQLAGYTNYSSNVKIVFKGTSSYDFFDANIYIDDVVVESAPECKTPVDLNLLSIGTTSATITWNLSTAGSIPSQYIVKVKDASGNTIIQHNALSAPDMTYAITGLTAYTTYTVELQGDCNPNHGISPVGTLTFTTLCDATNAPYSENFNSLTSLPACTHSLNAAISSSGRSGKALTLTTTSSGAAYIIFPELNLASNAAEVSLWVKSNSTSGGNPTIQFGIVSDLSDIAAYFEPLHSLTPANTSWNEVRFLSSSTTSAVTPTTMFAVFVPNDFVRTISIDDVDIHAIPNCLAPGNITASSIGPDTAVISWSYSTAQNVRIYAISGNDTISALANSQPYVFRGLTPQTAYTFTARAICSATDSSAMSSPSASVKTLCAVKTSPLFTESFDATTTAYTAPECWNMGWFYRNSTSVTAPFSTKTTYKHSGTRSMALVKQPAGWKSYLTTDILPIDSAYKYSLSVWVFRTAAMNYPDEGLKFWVTPTPNDTTGGTLLGYIPRNYYSAPRELEYSKWFNYEFPIPVAGNQYIVIEGISQNGSETYFDDLEVMLTPNCREVTDIKITTSDTSAIIRWSPGMDEQQWIVQYSITDGTTTVTDTVVVNDTTYTITSLTPNTAYTISGNIISYCYAGATATPMPFSNNVRTQCTPTSAFPVTESFEGESFPPACWSIGNISGTNRWVSSTSYASTGSKSASAQYGTAVNMPSLSSPAISFAPSIAYEVCFDMYRGNGYSMMTSEALHIFVSDRANDTVGATELGSVAQYYGNAPAEARAGNYRYTYDIPATLSGTKYIVFAYACQRGTAIYIDNVVIREKPTCLDLSGTPSIVERCDTAVRFRYIDSEPTTEWSYAYGPHNGDVSTFTTGDATDSIVTITGLTANTSYDLYLRRKCDNGDTILYGAWGNVTTFTTTATPAKVPYYCDFENSAERANWQFANGNGVNHFAIGSAAGAHYNGSYGLYVSDDNGTTYTYSVDDNPTTSYAYRTIEMENKTYQIDFKWKLTGGESSNADFARVMLVPASSRISGGSGTTFSLTSFPAGAIFIDPEGQDKFWKTTGTGWAELDQNNWGSVSKEVNMRGRAGFYNLAILWSNNYYDGTANSPFAIDSIAISEVRCITPAGISVSNITSNSATVTVANAQTDTLEMMLGSQSIVSTNGTFSLTGLSSNTEYTFAIRKICNAGDTGNWSQPTSFTTLCATESMPYSEDFENTNSANCWSQLVSETTGSITRTSTAQHSGSFALRIEKASAVSPELAADSLTHYVLSGWAYASKANSTIDIGIIVDPEDITTHESISTVTIANSNRWTAFSAYFNVLATPEYEDFRYARHIVLTTGTDTIILDDIHIELATACPAPTEPIISNVTDSSFDISFHNNAVATQWIVYTNNQPHTITTNPATISGLVSYSSYEVGIAALCSATDTSAITDCGTVATLCGKRPTPWFCGFEADEGFAPATTYTSDVLTDHCWSTINVKYGNSPNPYYYITTAYSYSGTQALYTNTAIAAQKANMYLIFPEFADPADSLDVQFLYKNASTNATSSQLLFGYLTDAGDETTFVTIQALTRKTAWTVFNYSTGSQIGMPANARLALCISKNTNGGAIYVDDITVEATPSCTRPKQPAFVTTTKTTATVTLNMDGKPEAEVRCGDNVSVITTNGTATFDSLTAATEYAITYRYICAAGDTSGWSPAATATTDSTDCFALLPYSESFETIATTYTYRMIGNICWTALNAGTNTTETPYYTGYTAQHTNGQQSLRLVGSNNEDLYLVMPEMASLGNARMTFDVKYENVIASGQFYAGYLTDAANPASFVAVTATSISQAWTSYGADFGIAPAGARIAFRYAAGTFNSSSVYLDNVKVTELINGGTYNDTICYGSYYSQHGFSIPANQISVGNNTFTRFHYASDSTEADTTYTANVYMRANIVSLIKDTICQGEPYIKGVWNIPNPATSVYTNTLPGAAACGCDSSIILDLTVLPVSHLLNETICEGETYIFGDSAITTPGTYIRSYITSHGCQTTDTLVLAVIPDSLFSADTICVNELPYEWMGIQITAAGRHTVQTAGAAGCPQTNVLDLTVSASDSTIFIHFCHGGSVFVVDTTITTAGTYTLKRVNRHGCDVAYHINATTDSLTAIDVYDDVCEGYRYTGNGLYNIVVESDTVIMVQGRTSDAHCDSLTAVHIKVNPTQHSDTTVTIKSGDYFEWHETSYTKAGTYVDTLYDINGCDSVTTLTLKVTGTAVENIADDLRIEIVPNPVNAGATAFVYGVFDDVEIVEILDNYGQVIMRFTPATYPIELRKIEASGLYYVRITTANGQVHTQKLIVK